MSLFAKKIFSVCLFFTVFCLPFYAFAQLGGGYGAGGSQNQDLDISSTIGNVGNKTGLPYNSVYGILLNFLLWLLQIFTILAIISFIVAGVMFLLAGSDKGLADKAKTAIGYSIIGIVVALSAYILILLISELLWGGMEGGGGLTFF